MVITRLLDTAGRAMEVDRDGARRLLARATALLADSPTRARPPAVTRGGLAPWQMRRVAMQIDAKLDGPLHVAELAETVRLSAYHFGRAFKVSFGQSPYAYVLRKRMERAQELMLTTDQPLAQIAIACGLADQAHLSRLFRQIMGESPNAWRRQHSTGA
ncbi:helix-turn-helix domain-containing protein [Humitalea rosea]|nr:AraC family transcriptional regulator [Humitalea rosea]